MIAILSTEPSVNWRNAVPILTGHSESGRLIDKLPDKSCEKNSLFTAKDLENMNLQEKFETIGSLALEKKKLRWNVTVFSYVETATMRKGIIFSMSLEDRTRSDGHKFSNRKLSWTLGAYWDSLVVRRVKAWNGWVREATATSSLNIFKQPGEENLCLS